MKVDCIIGIETKIIIFATGIGGVINRPKGQANSPSPFLICWQFLKVGNYGK